MDLYKNLSKDKKQKNSLKQGKGKNLVEEYRKVGFGKSSLPGGERPHFFNKKQKSKSKIHEQLVKDGQLNFYGKQNENHMKILGRNANDYSNLYSRFILKDLNNGSSASL